VTRIAVAALATVLAFPTAAAAMRWRSAFVPSDPLVSKQYYLGQDHAFDAFGAELPAVTPVRVAIIDSGIDGSHPEFPKSKIWAGRSFVGGRWDVDEQGHGTFVAGMIAAALNNEGIAGIAFPAQLIIAKIARADQSISVQDEADAIRWAADRGAQVINLSIGGLRDPLNRRRDTFSQVEANALEYAYRRGAVLVAAIGNGDEAPTTPWLYGSYPAALPHVLGVSALTPTGNVPAFSNRDLIYNDIAAPGQEIYSTLPRALTSQRPTCANQGYSECGPEEFRHASGTSFAAPQVTAAAAVLLGLRPTLTHDQVMNVLERTATDVNAATGCRQCALLRDPLSGWGRLDIARAVAALDGVLPPADRLEPNDDAGTHAAFLPRPVGTLRATVDFWDDQIDVYKLRLNRNERLMLDLEGPKGTNINLLLWRPGTKRVSGLRGQNMRVAQAIRPGSSQRLAYRAPRAGAYYAEVKLATRGSGSYALSITRRK
jgi:subtilisin family serine protease